MPVEEKKKGKKASLLVFEIKKAECCFNNSDIIKIAFSSLVLLIFEY